jgi:hypothetical protein
VIEACQAIPFPNAIFTADFLRFWIGRRGEGGERGRYGLDAAVEGGRVETLDGRGECREVGGEFVGLCYAVAGERGVGGDSCGGGDGGAVFAGFGVDYPVGAKLGGFLAGY